MRLLLIDNYDSFTYNLYQLLCMQGLQVEIVMNDDCLLQQALSYDAIVISPGPGKPSDIALLQRLIRQHTHVPILGVCLGHQCLAAAYGAQIARASYCMHGKASIIMHTHSALFRGIATSFSVARYHSLLVNRTTLPNTLHITAQTVGREIMAIQHTLWPHYGMQFHPESLLTRQGKTLIANFKAIMEQHHVKQ